MCRFNTLAAFCVAFAGLAFADAKSTYGMSLDDLKSIADDRDWQVLDIGLMGEASVLVENRDGMRFVLAGADCQSGAELVCSQVLTVVRYDSHPNMSDKRIAYLRSTHGGSQIHRSGDDGTLSIARVSDVSDAAKRARLVEDINATLWTAKTVYASAVRGSASSEIDGQAGIPSL